VAEVVGANPEHPFEALQTLADGHQEPGGLFSEAIRMENGGIRADSDRLEQALDAVRAECPSDLARDSPHVAVEQARRRLAGSAIGRASAVIGQLASDAARAREVERVAFTGDSFASPMFAEHVLARTDGARLAPVTASIGAALGAALLPHPNPPPITELSVGQAFSDDEIKAVLDNCRLDYVYEPNWSRLYPRMSQLLKAGAFVGWFQGRSDFGTCSLGNRSVLCDPSSRYARENVNVYLLRRSLRHPLPLSLAASAARDCGFAGDPLRFAPGVPTVDGWRQHLTAVLDAQRPVPLHVPSERTAPELARMLEAHRHDTGVPGLINVPLAATGQVVVTPRDAIRAMFGSPIDVLVMGRFLVSKDYWLVRRQ
jgi:predicted NodU family carbamoyl transferase